MFRVTLNLLFKPQRLAHAPHSSRSSNQGSLQEMTLSVFRAVIREGCSHGQAHAGTLMYLLGRALWAPRRRMCHTLDEQTLVYTHIHMYSILNTGWQRGGLRHAPLPTHVYMRTRSGHLAQGRLPWLLHEAARAAAMSAGSSQPR